MGNPRGVQLNNPGNIRIGDPWQGLAKESRDDEFCTFETPVWGFRAMAINLIAYQDRYKINTVRGIINKWAPPEDKNDTESYIKAVCRSTGFAEDEPLNMHDYSDIYKIIRAITKQEQGSFEQYFQPWQLDEGLRRAGIENIPQRPIIKTLSGAGTAVTAAATAAASSPETVISVINQVKPVLDSGSSQTLHHVFSGIAIIGIALILIGLLRKRARSGV